MRKLTANLELAIMTEAWWKAMRTSKKFLFFTCFLSQQFHLFKLAFLHAALSVAECDIFSRGENENDSKLWSLDSCLKFPHPRFNWFYTHTHILDYKESAFCWHWVRTGEVNHHALRAQKLKDEEKWQHLTESLNFLQSMLKELAEWNLKSASRREATAHQWTCVSLAIPQWPSPWPSPTSLCFLPGPNLGIGCNDY